MNSIELPQLNSETPSVSDQVMPIPFYRSHVALLVS